MDVTAWVDDDIEADVLREAAEARLGRPMGVHVTRSPALHVEVWPMQGALTVDDEEAVRAAVQAAGTVQRRRAEARAEASRAREAQIDAVRQRAADDPAFAALAALLGVQID